MDKGIKNTAMKGGGRTYSFAPQDGIQETTIIEAETFEEAEQKFKEKVKAHQA